jgi:hypothetical protein
MMRWLSLIALLNAVGLSWYAIVNGKEDIILISTFLGVAFTGKVVQKVFEDKKSDMQGEVKPAEREPVTLK